MVRLTMTNVIVASITFCAQNAVTDWPLQQAPDEPEVNEPAPGKPISHSQVIALSRCLRAHLNRARDTSLDNHVDSPVCDLDTLLRGSRVYVEPPKPKAEPTAEYTALMARLRREEEARAYERMINPPIPSETFAQRFPNPLGPQLVPRTTYTSSTEDDEVTFADINRQMALIINVLLSIVACGVAIWMAASRWSTPSRLGLSMGGSGIVGIAEVVVYAGYIQRIQNAKARSKKEVEVKEIVKTWVIESNGKPTENKVSKPVGLTEKQTTSLRRRNRGIEKA